MKSGIYVITSPSGKGYVGSSRNLPRRRIRHFNDLRNNRHYCVALQRAWNKYGDRLNFVVIEYCSPDHLNEREQFWLDHSIFKELYNSRSLAGIHGPLDETTRQRISQSIKGVAKSEATKEKMRKPKTADHAAAISRGKKGNNGRWSPERLAIQREVIKKAQEALRQKRERVKMAAKGI